MGGDGGDGGNNNGNAANGGGNNSGDFSGNGGFAIGDNGDGGDGGNAVGGESHRKCLVMFLNSNKLQNKAVAVATSPLSFHASDHTKQLLALPVVQPTEACGADRWHSILLAWVIFKLVCQCSKQQFGRRSIHCGMLGIKNTCARQVEGLEAYSTLCCGTFLQQSMTYHLC